MMTYHITYVQQVRITDSSKGGFKFYERTEVKVVLDYLRIVHQPDNNDALARIINVPKRGIGDTTVKALLEEAEKSSLSLWALLTKRCRGDRISKTTIRKQSEQRLSGELIRLINGLQTKWRQPAADKDMDLVRLIEKLLSDLRFEKHLEDTYGDEYQTRWANVQEFVNLAAEFMKDSSLAEEDMLPDIEGLQQVQENDVLARFLANVSLASDKQTDENGEEDKPLVTVSTIHAAKGLEWPIVFIPAVYKGSIPHMRSDDEAEERRLLYVAMTRAQALLYLSCPLYSLQGNGEGLELSPFIEDLSSTHFLKKGPSFENQTMQSVAKILGRELPSGEVIYKGMAMMTPIEDTLFPVDPLEAKQPDSLTGGASSDARQPKRPKTRHTSSSSRIGPETVEGWNTPYTTTMERSSSFTLPGFTTAGAHHESNPPAPMSISAGASRPGPTAPKRGSSNRAPTQRTLLGFVVTDHDRSKPTTKQAVSSSASQSSSGVSQNSGRPSSYGARQPSLPLPRVKEATAIEPSLLHHKLGSAKSTGRPTRPPSEVTGPGKEYSFFSSSPPKPDQEPEEAVVPEEEQTRPAPCFHTTTVHAPQVFRGVKRPAGLGRENIAPMERLRKPFKPLTMSRNRGPGPT